MVGNFVGWKVRLIGLLNSLLVGCLVRWFTLNNGLSIALLVWFVRQYTSDDLI